MNLRDYQVDAVNHLLSEEVARLRSGAVGLPQGSGKSLVLSVAAARALREGRAQRVVALVPQAHIERGFARDLHVETPWGRMDYTAESWEVPREGQGTSEEDRAYLNRFYAGDRPWMVTTYAKGERLRTAWPRERYAQTLFLLDEAHHAGTADDLDSPETKQIRRVVDQAHSNGAHVWMTSATLFRQDRLALLPADVDPFVVGYAQIAARGVLPYRIEMRSLCLPTAPRAGGEITDEELRAVVDLVLREGRPASVRLPPSRTGYAGESRRAALRTQELFAERGMDPSRVLILTGSRQEDDVQEGLERLAAERDVLRAKGYPGRTFDVVLSVARMREATDWPICSMDVAVGAPSNPLTYVQGVGRATRPKREILGYPSAWVDHTLGVIVLPREDDQTAAVKRALLACLVLEGSSAAGSYARFWLSAVRHAQPMAPGQPRGTRRSYLDRVLDANPQAQEEAIALTYSAAAALAALEDRDPTLDDLGRETLSRFIRAQVDQPQRDALLRLVSLGDLEGTLRGIIESGGDLAAQALVHAFAHVLALAGTTPEQKEKLGGWVAAHLQSAVEAADQGYPEPVDPLLPLFLRAVATFSDLVVPIRQEITRIGQMGFSTTLTPHELTRVTTTLEAYRDEAYKLSIEDGVALIRNYWRVNKKLPRLGPESWNVGRYLPRGMGHIAHYSLRDADRAIRRTSEVQGGLAIGIAEINTCLSRGYYDGTNPSGTSILPGTLSVQDVQAALRRWPRRRNWSDQPAALRAALGDISCGKTHSEQDLQRVFRRPETAVGLDLALRFGWRGLPGGSSLKQLIQETL